jgi:hypothetical protein
MSGGFVFLLIICGMFAALIFVAVVTKLRETLKVARWPSVVGKVIASGVKSRKKQPSDPGYDFNDTEISNQPRVVYEYKVGNRKYLCERITIKERTGGEELEAILARYPVGASVTVYYDPKKPQSALLERDIPWGKLVTGVGCLLLFFSGGPLLAGLVYYNAVAWIQPHLVNTGKAPFVTAVGGFGLAALLIALGYTKWVWRARYWPVTSGRIVSSGVEAFQSSDVDSEIEHFKPSVVYSYVVNGREYRGDRLVLGVKRSSSVRGFAQRQAAKYPVVSEVDVYYDPASPGDSVLNPRSRSYLVPWLIAAGILAFAWAVATGRLNG